jgi:hypothetical protein
LPVNGVDGMFSHRKQSLTQLAVSEVSGSR